MFSYEFCEISKNTFFTEHLWTTASNVWQGSEYASELAFKVKSIWISKVTENLLLGKAKKEKAERTSK